MNEIFVFNETDVKAFLEIVSKMLLNKSTKPLEAKFPASNFIHTFSGHKNKEIFFNVTLLMTTKHDLLMQIENVIQEYIHKNLNQFDQVI